MSTRTRRRSSGSAAIALVELRVEVRAVAFPAQHPGLVVDPGAVERRPRRTARRQLAQVVDRPVDRVAQPEHLQVRVRRREVPDVHRHRVGVVEQPGVRADLGHVARPGRRGSRRCAARGRRRRRRACRRWSGGRRSASGPRSRSRVAGVAADVDRVDDEVGAGQSRPPVERRPARSRRSRPWCSTAMSASPSASVEPSAGRCRAYQGRAAPQIVEGQQVAEQLAGELGRSGADEDRRWSRGGACHAVQ